MMPAFCAGSGSNLATFGSFFASLSSLSLLSPPSTINDIFLLLFLAKKHGNVTNSVEGLSRDKAESLSNLSETRKEQRGLVRPIIHSIGIDA